MGNWIIRWNFNKASYVPGELAQVSFWLENTNSNYLFVSELGIEFDFGSYKFESVSGMVPLGPNMFLGNVSLSLPKNVVGIKIFRLKYRMSEYVNNNWVDLGFSTTDMQYFISVFPAPFYRVFVSRGLQIEDRAIGDPIVELIREWSLYPVTVGVERQVSEKQVPVAVKEEIKRAEAVIAIATPRSLDALTGVWRTLEWAHAETAIGFGINKPLLILKDRRVSLGGLPSYLTAQNVAPLIEFDYHNLEDLKKSLSVVMPGFREWVESQRRQEFFDGLGRLAVGGLAFVGGITVVSGIVGALSGTSKR